MNAASRLRSTTLALWLAVALPPTTVTADEVAFLVTPGGEQNLVRFDSKAPLESFGGTTRQVSCEIRLDPAVLGDTVAVYVEVDLATLETGIGLRDQHMRNNHLETTRFPLATFRGARIVGEHPARLTPGESVTLEIEGLFSLHGVERPVRVPVSVIYEKSLGHERLGIECRFQVKLSDHNIPRPQFLALKVGDEQRITFRALAVSTP